MAIDERDFWKTTVVPILMQPCEEALRRLKEIPIFELTPELVDSLQLTTAQVLEELDRHDEAIVQYRLISSRRATSYAVLAQYSIVISYVQTDDLHAALAAARELIEDFPDSDQAPHALAWMRMIYKRHGDSAGLQATTAKLDQEIQRRLSCGTVSATVGLLALYADRLHEQGADDKAVDVLKQQAAEYARIGLELGVACANEHIRDILRQKRRGR